MPAGTPRAGYPSGSDKKRMGAKKVSMSMTNTPFASLAMFFPQNAYPQALQLILASVSGEREDELFYDFLLSQAPTAEDNQIITSIRDDERKHFRLLRELYCALTGQTPPPAPEPVFERPQDYCDGIHTALFGELAAVERYRKILYGVSFFQPYFNVLTEIYTDEQKHATKWLYLYYRNACAQG